MHPDLSDHLHTPECNELINKLKECHATNKFGKFIGQCNEIDSELNKCLKNERRLNQESNLKRATEKRDRIHQKLRERSDAQEKLQQQQQQQR